MRERIVKSYYFSADKNEYLDIVNFNNIDDIKIILQKNDLFHIVNILEIFQGINKHSFSARFISGYQYPRGISGFNKLAQ